MVKEVCFWEEPKSCVKPNHLQCGVVECIQCACWFWVWDGDICAVGDRERGEIWEQRLFQNIIRAGCEYETGEMWKAGREDNDVHIEEGEGDKVGDVEDVSRGEEWLGILLGNCLTIVMRGDGKISGLLEERDGN